MDFIVENIHKFPDDGTLRAIADVTVDDLITIKGLRVLSGKNGLFVSMPREMGKNDKWYDKVVCKTREVRQLISDKVIEAYHAGELSRV